MLNFRFSIITIFLFLATNSFGQTPGYLGKRLFIEGNIGVNVGLDFASIANNGTARVSVNWVRSRYRYIALEIGYQQFLSTQDPIFTFAGQPSLKYQVSTQSLGIGFFKTSRKKIKSLAPIGYFIGYKFIFSRSAATPVKYADSNEDFSGAERAAYNLRFEKPELYFLGLTISSGFRTVLNDRFTLNYSFNLGYNLPLGDNFSDDRIYPFSKNDLQSNNSFFLYITVGGGVLLF